MGESTDSDSRALSAHRSVPLVWLNLWVLEAEAEDHCVLRGCIWRTAAHPNSFTGFISARISSHFINDTVGSGFTLGWPFDASLGKMSSQWW